MRIFFPVLLKKGAPLMLLYGIFFFGAYEVPLLLGQQAPQAVTVFITEKMDKFDLMNIPVGHAMATVYTMIVALLATFFLKRGNKNFDMRR
jgi:putative spermidine/putrescine transport system permease protein